MTFHILLLLGIGDFIETNPGVTVLIVTTIGGILAGYIRLEYLAKTTREDLNETMDRLDKHTGNADAHVNQLYIGTLKDRISSVEADIKVMRREMNDGHQKIGDKIDAKFDALARRMEK